MANITDLKPREVWAFFEEITRIPRPSKHEEKMREYLVAFAAKRGLQCTTDRTGNVVIVKPATKGMESVPGVVLQSHMDMVCEKNSGVQFDFSKDAIRAHVDGDWVRADGTTLGADDGIGIAAALAVLDSKELRHGALEALFTVDEETGLTGAFGLEKGVLKGKYLINLDSEDEGEIFIGCAGGVDTLATFRPVREALPAEFTFFRIAVSGLKGGHSGDNIADGLANSNKLLARVLWPATKDLGMRLAEIDGGNLRNAIPREAWAIVGVHDHDSAAFKALFEKVSLECATEFAATESSMEFTIRKVERGEVKHVFDLATQQRLIGAIHGVTNGVQSMSRSMPGLVETSTNLASIKEGEGGSIVVTSSQRSSVESAKWDVAFRVEAVFGLAGAQVVHSEGYPGWEPNPDSGLLKVTAECYKKLFGVEPKVRAIHAGLECGLFLEKYPHLEMVSFGPTLRGVHSPDERLEIASVDKFWKLLAGVLAVLAG